MSQSFTPPPPPGAALPHAPIAQQSVDVRADFMRGVYTNLVLGIVAFIGISFVLLSDVLFATPPAAVIYELVVGTNWLLILGGFMLVSWLASRLSVSARTPGQQWAGYGLLVLANALLFATPLYIATQRPELQGTVGTAALLSVLAFGGLSLVAVRSSKDFSFLGTLLKWGGILALVAIVAGVLTGSGLGTLFVVAMIGFAGGAILYDTQKIYRSFPPGTEVIAAMHLFSSIALLFWYVLQLLMRR
ncbi:Bax inhibitor-1/YccA family protein [Egicoccus halophilus]|uniref:Permease n=1 Tax=Egicoccus halophilus TaxID=1670830 RepID=A0A8J3A5Z3_9ACTN|nr:Bax inhibitor-1 family protein [Egicoccus halophilus]GGI03997.1 permease [Egicoccus halophilus]